MKASEARALMPDYCIEEKLKYAYLKIEESAKNNNNLIRLHDDFFVKEGFRNTKAYNQVKKKLEEDGYEVEFYYKEASIAVDMYTIIKW